MTTAIIGSRIRGYILANYFFIFFMENTNEQANAMQFNQGDNPTPLYSIIVEWAEGHGAETDAADGAKVAKEFFDNHPTADDMPASINAITIKRI